VIYIAVLFFPVALAASIGRRWPLDRAGSADCCFCS